MRAFVITGPGQGAVRDIDPPSPAPGQVVVDVERAGVCGTDMEFFTGHMAYLRTGEAHYPVRIGHEWCGVVARAGDEATASWVGQRVTGDTMLGCGRCRRCLGGRQHLCAERYEIGIRGGWPGALAEQLLVPASALQPLPAGVGAAVGALVEPGGNALRAVRAALAGGGQRLLVMGPGTIGLLAAQIARSLGAEVHLLGRDERSLRFARDLGFGRTWLRDTLPDLPVRRGPRRVDRAGTAVAGRRDRGAGRPGRLYRPVRRAQPGRHADAGAEGRHRDRRAQRLRRPRPRRSPCTPAGPSTRGPSSPRPSGWTKWPTCWPVTGRPSGATPPRSTSTRNSVTKGSGSRPAFPGAIPHGSNPVAVFLP